MASAVDKLLNIARAEIGYLEKATNANLDSKTANAGMNDWNKYARDLDKTNLYNGKKNGYWWCDIFCDWCFVQAFGFDTAVKMTFQPLKGAGAGCTYSAQYYKKAGRFFKSPKPGDQIFFTSNKGSTYYHTGLVESVTSTTVTTIEGNTTSGPGVVRNGGAVNRKTYKLSNSQIGGYGRPNWDLVGGAGTVSSSSTSSNTTTSTSSSGVVTAAALNVRLGPGISYGKTDCIKQGTNVNIVQTNGKWYKITYGAKSGWVNSAYIKINTKKTTTANLNMRSGRGTNYKVICTIPKGTAVAVSNLSGGWYQVVYNGKTGYCSSQYLK